MTWTASILVALIAAAATVATAALTFFLTKAKEREALWRTQKLDHYKAFMAALNAIVGPPPKGEDRIRFADAANNIFLVGSSKVLVALREFLDETADSNTRRPRDRHDELLTALLVAIREDVGVKGSALPDGFVFHLWSGRNPLD